MTLNLLRALGERFCKGNHDTGGGWENEADIRKQLKKH